MNLNVVFLLLALVLGGVYYTNTQISPSDLVPNENSSIVDVMDNVTMDTNSTLSCKPLPVVGNLLCELEYGFCKEANNNGYECNHLLFYMVIILVILLLLSMFSGSITTKIYPVLVYGIATVLILLLLGVI